MTNTILDYTYIVIVTVIVIIYIMLNHKPIIAKEILNYFSLIITSVSLVFLGIQLINTIGINTESIKWLVLIPFLISLIYQDFVLDMQEVNRVNCLNDKRLKKAENFMEKGADEILSTVNNLVSQKIPTTPSVDIEKHRTVVINQKPSNNYDN
jgi:hypothetical protein